MFWSSYRNLTPNSILFVIYSHSTPNAVAHVHARNPYISRTSAERSGWEKIVFVCLNFGLVVLSEHCTAAAAAATVNAREKWCLCLTATRGTNVLLRELLFWAAFRTGYVCFRSRPHAVGSRYLFTAESVLKEFFFQNRSTFGKVMGEKLSCWKIKNSLEIWHMAIMYSSLTLTLWSTSSKLM